MRPLITITIMLAATAALAADFPHFEEVVIDDAAAKKAVYAVALADVNGDGKDDIVAVNENQVIWYENPGWEKHVILENQTELDNVCIAPHDIEGDGQIDFALGAGWTSTGTIQWIRRGENPDDKWRVHSIGVEPWTHRMRWADVLETGEPQLIVSPLNATQGAGVRLLAFEIPSDPASDPWPSTVIDDSLNRMHNHWHLESGDDRRVSTITASQEGLFAFTRNEDGSFKSRQITEGIEGETPESSGAGEVKHGRLHDGRTFLATIEPMHGTTVAVYTENALRTVIDDSLKGGHAVWCADLDGDGGDEIIVGHREVGDGEVKGPGVYVYTADDATGTSWTKHVIDNGDMACEDLLCGDLNGDGRPDIIAGGRATLNVKLYLNQP